MTEDQIKSITNTVLSADCRHTAYENLRPMLREFMKELRDENDAIRKEWQQCADEKEAAIKAFTEIRKSFEGRHWLMEGRGMYPYNDDRYKEEVRYIMNEFKEINSKFWSEIKSKTFEYRQKIEEPLIREVAELETSNVLLTNQNEQFKSDYVVLEEKFIRLQTNIVEYQNEKEVFELHKTAMKDALNMRNERIERLENILLPHQELTQWIEEQIMDENDFDVSHDFIQLLYNKVYKINH